MLLPLHIELFLFTIIVGNIAVSVATGLISTHQDFLVKGIGQSVVMKMILVHNFDTHRRFKGDVR